MKAKDVKGVPVKLALRRANRKTSKLVRVLESHWETLDQIITSLEKDPEAQKIRMGKNQDREVLPLVRDAHSKLSKMLSDYRLTRHGKTVSGGLTHLAGVMDKVAMQFPTIRFHPAPREMFDLLEFNPTSEGEQFPHHHVSSNALELERAFYNLCKNAKEAGARNIWREINDFGQGTLAVNFKDDGKGIPEEHHDELFQKGNTFGKKGGTGLGLWSIRRKLRTFGADIDLTRSKTSGPERGTWFTLIFPKLTTFTGKKLPLLKK